MDMEDVLMVKAWNCVVVLNFDPLNLIGLMFDCCLIPKLSQAHDPVLRMHANWPSIVVVAPPYLIDLVAMIKSIDCWATWDSERSTLGLAAVAKMGTAFEMILHCYCCCSGCCYCCCLPCSRYSHSLNPCLAFDFSQYYQRKCCLPCETADNCENHYCCLEDMLTILKTVNLM